MPRLPHTTNPSSIPSNIHRLSKVADNDMPKKYHKFTNSKPSSTVHPSLTSFAALGPKNGGSKAESGHSVNDLIRHLRRTQVSRHDEAVAGPSLVAPRSVHPSIRNLLELPETPPPRPRPGTRVVGERRVRRTPGPAAPMSWLVPNNMTDRGQPGGENEHDDVGNDIGGRNIRLDRLPGILFPQECSLQHMILKSMALNWDSHLLYDGVFLSELPTLMKQLLLSYIATYTYHASMEIGMKGLKPLFLDGSEDDVKETHSDVIRLDLGSAIGRWITLKQLTREVKATDGPESLSHSKKQENTPPFSWEEEAEAQHSSSIISTTLPQPLQQRFHNLKFLSLANPIPQEANWPSLLNLLNHLSTITHLSLAFWPTPTLTPNSLTASMKSPKLSSLTFAYGGTDMYSAFENNWIEAAAVLRKLSKVTYCLKWLDLEGCSDWLPALSWNGIDAHGNFHVTAGPEWNGAWRGVEWLALGPGWFPDVSDVEDLYFIYEKDKALLRGVEPESGDPPTPGSSRVRDRKFCIKERDEYRRLIGSALEVKKQVQAIRTKGGGKWLEVTLGPESEGELRMRVCGDIVK
ncbi:hypothetical protein PAAG_00143 [Paracoccidioides lutzii Pb01]|uniref:Tafazzin n=1 Tax=Paracoccidioides lutzii (strain ATCC MYA-826 / Pb01) TaxID=502779 RepID=C1GNP8_PARBA|nr:hypothetical protein PAAG_00143 [Paracoccidioides lutzii Pb01]EEH35820.1 hypothetical protein PAAG_00143 [Paracoccidioides lutzii Pb01]